MQKMDPHTLFSIFEQGDEQIYKEHGLEDTLENPFVLMGMVVRGLDNYHLMDQMYMRQYPKRYKQVRRITKYKYFNKLFGYLTRIDSTNFDQFYKIGESFDKSHVFNVLDYLRLYYEGIEEYEKCAIVKRYIDLLQTHDKEEVMDFRM